MDTRVDFPQASLAARSRASHLPRRWTSDRVTSLFMLALALPLAAALYEDTASMLPVLGGALVVALGWTLLFARLRGKAMNWHAVPTAILFALLAPAELPLWQVLLALSFGLVFGEQVFGGRGYSFLNPTVTALAFLYFSFPAASAGTVGSQLVALAVIPGALLLLATGLVSWRILTGFAAGLAGWIAVRGMGVPGIELLTPALVLGAVHLVADPVSAAATNTGRVVHGLLVGALVVILGAAGNGIGATPAIVFAALLGSIFAPLIDGLVIHLNVRRRRRRSWPTSIR
ncbi:MAG: RnfABCDGE type electron transport complex subunit D [Rhizobiaceae bacterium]|nr:RnfABCDGE type electron transport complex subunit D [Rhizobiaceae bacterium]